MLLSGMPSSKNSTRSHIGHCLEYPFWTRRALSRKLPLHFGHLIKNESSKTDFLQVEAVSQTDLNAGLHGNPKIAPIMRRDQRSSYLIDRIYE